MSERKDLTIVLMGFRNFNVINFLALCVNSQDCKMVNYKCLVYNIMFTFACKLEDLTFLSMKDSETETSDFEVNDLDLKNNNVLSIENEP